MKAHVHPTQTTQSNMAQSAVRKPQFADHQKNRYALQELIDNNPQSQQAAQLQSMADGYAAQQPLLQQSIAKYTHEAITGNTTELSPQLKAGFSWKTGQRIGPDVPLNSSKPKEIGAPAYAQGNDGYVRSNQEPYILREGSHVIQQLRGEVKPTMQLKGGGIHDRDGLEKKADMVGAKAPDAGCNAYRDLGFQGTFQTHEIPQVTNVVVQGAFHPAKVTRDSRFIALSRWNKETEDLVDADSEIVVNREDKMAEGGADYTLWTRAVNVRASDWTWAMRQDGGNYPKYIRDADIAPIAYPQPVEHRIESRNQLIPEKRWHERAGEYIFLEESSAVRSAKLVVKNQEIKRLTEKYIYQEPSMQELIQVAPGHYLNLALRSIFDDIAGRIGVESSVLDSKNNLLKLEKLLRSKMILNYINISHNMIDDYYTWLSWVVGVLGRITEGAEFVAASLHYWLGWMKDRYGQEVAITKIELTGSDLHDKGLGAMFVTFRLNHVTPTGGNDITFVLKPEDKTLEKALFGKEKDSLANQINMMAHLSAEEAISTFEMHTSEGYGSLVEKVEGVQPDTFKHPQTPVNAMKEAVVFAFITGLSDLHHENLLWREGKPYFIDADNAMIKSRLDFALDDNQRHQVGFNRYNEGEYRKALRKIEKEPGKSDSKIMKAALQQPDLFINAIKKVFTGKKGRVVPLTTKFWADILTNLYSISLEGAPGDIHDPQSEEKPSKWAIASRQAAHVPEGNKTNRSYGHGLKGETGEALDGNQYDQGEEARQIKADYDQGKIPFYHYDFSSGQVRHNGQVVWHGQSVEQTLKILLQKLKAQ